LLSNTLKIKRLEHQSCRQEGNFIDRERLSGEMHSRVQQSGASWALEWEEIDMCKDSTLT
jgi:hypothetical protein